MKNKRCQEEVGCCDDDDDEPRRKIQTTHQEMSGAIRVLRSAKDDSMPKFFIFRENRRRLRGRVFMKCNGLLMDPPERQAVYHFKNELYGTKRDGLKTRLSKKLIHELQTACGLPERPVLRFRKLVHLKDGDEIVSRIVTRPGEEDADKEDAAASAFLGVLFVGNNCGYYDHRIKCGERTYELDRGNHLFLPSGAKYSVRDRANTDFAFCQFNVYAANHNHPKHLCASSLYDSGDSDLEELDSSDPVMKMITKTENRGRGRWNEKKYRDEDEDEEMRELQHQKQDLWCLADLLKGKNGWVAPSAEYARNFINYFLVHTTEMMLAGRQNRFFGM